MTVFQSGFSAASVQPKSIFSFRNFALVLAALLIVIFYDIVFGLGTFVARDYGLFGYPLAFYCHESFWHGEVPLWNPYNNCGLPFLAQWSTQPLYPLSILYLLFPLPWSLGFFCLLHLWFAGAGMYVLTARWTGSSYAAAVAGLAFVFSGFSLNCLIWPNNIAALAWMPWVVHFTSVSWGGRKRGVLWAAGAGAMQMLAGAPEVILLTWVAVAVFWAKELIWPRESRNRPVWRFPATILLIALLSAAQLLPFFDLLKHSDRTASFDDNAWSMPAWGWSNLLVPLFRFHQDPNGVFAQTGQGWTTSYYAGIVVLFLALVALYRARDARVPILLGLSVVCLLLALGENTFIYPALRKALPQLGIMRYPIKFIILPMFALPLVAGFGAKELSEAFAGKHERGLIRFMAVLTVAFSVAIAAILWFAHGHPFPDEIWTATLRSGVTRMLLLALTFAAAFALRRPAFAPVASFAFLVLIPIDGLTHAPSQNPTVPLAAYEPGLAAAEMKPTPRLGVSRAMLSRATYEKLHSHILSNPLLDYTGRRIGLSDNTGLLDGIPSVGGFYSLQLREMRELWLSALALTTGPSPLADFAGIAQISDPDKFLAWQTRPDYLPMVTIGQKPVFQKETDILNSITADSFRPRDIVYLPQSVKPVITAKEKSAGTISDLSVGAHRIALNAEAVQPAVLVINQAYYHNWGAYVDEHPVPLWPANYAFQAMEIPAGRHHVRIQYEDSLFRVGALISGITLIAWIVAALFSRPTRLARSEI
jgi:hypothetical protein